MDLFDYGTAEYQKKKAPLADRMRPQTLDQFAGQEHIIGRGRLLRRAIEIDQLSSIILYGPPGTGKTTLARIIANTTKAEFLSINAVLAGVKDIRDSIEKAQTTQKLFSRKTILFVDEVHRFNKAQQDALLPHVENGTITLIGATTENPYFEVNKALVSRSRIFQLRSLTEHDLQEVIQSAITDPERGYGKYTIQLDQNALEHLCSTANGDARTVLNALELAVETTAENSEGIITISKEIIEESIQRKAVLYDKDGDAHYDIISAFIKSLRGSDPDASLYWLAKMIYAGEDPRFIFRRMVIFASEDVGMADPQALQVVMAASQAFDFVGMPEGRFPLSQACLYLASAPKSNTSLALFDALKAVESESDGDVPNHLKDSSRDRKGFGHGEGYLYPHAYRDHWTAQQYLPKELQGKIFYEPSDQGFERSIRDLVIRRREIQIASLADSSRSDTFLWKGGAFGGWEQRTSEKRGGYFETVRNTFFDLADIKSEHLVLDLNCQSGFFTAEAVRRVQSGGIWSIAQNREDFELAEPYLRSDDTFAEPILLLRDSRTPAEQIAERAGGNVLFDRVIARNLISSFGYGDLSGIRDLLAEDGEIHLTELLPAEGSTLADSVVNSQIQEYLRAAESAVYQKSFRLDERMLQEVTGLSCTVRKVPVLLTDSFTKKTVQHWFRHEPDGSSLGDILENLFGKSVRELVRAELSGQLTAKKYPWYQCVSFIRLKKST